MKTKRIALKIFLWAGIFLAALQVSYAQRYELKSITSQRYEITNRYDRTVDSVALSILAPYREKVDSIMRPVLGVSAMYMAPGRPESLLSNWVADVLRMASTQYGRMTDIGLCNMGGLRSAMPKGNVTRGDILSISPFENMFCILSLRGVDLQELLEQIASVGGEGVSGIKMEIGADGKLLSALVNGKPVNPDRIYTIATIDFLAEGNDKMTALKKSVTRQITPKTMRDVLMEYIVEQNKYSKKLAAKMEGRITVVK